MDNPIHLNQKTLANLTEMDSFESIILPKKDRHALQPASAHIGFGHFHRAHFCDYLQELNNEHALNWGITEIDVMPDVKGIAKSLLEQNHYYSLFEKSPDGSERCKIMGPILNYINASQDPREAIAVLSSERTKLVTLTITEKGYYYLESDRTLAIDSPPIQHDLHAQSTTFQTVIGLLSAALWERFTNHLEQIFVVLSCDNIPSNGFVLETGITSFAKIKYPQMVSWLKEKVVFPNSMVDRITPNTTAADIVDLEVRYGIRDDLAVHCESYTQWVIDEKHKDLLPDFSKVGAVFTTEVEAYEKMKIRLLNGSHSALSYPSYLLGYRKVDEACVDPVIHDFIRKRYMEEITATLEGPQGFDFVSYKDSLLERFKNKYISDAILRLALDGSKKIYNAIIPPLLESYTLGSPNNAMILSLAFWARFLLGYDESNNPIPIEDDYADSLTELAHRALTDPIPFLRYIGVHDMKEEHWNNLIARFSLYVTAIMSDGVRTVLASF